MVKQYNGDSVKVTFIYNDYLDKPIFEIINKLQYTPSIQMLNGKIISI